jgi:rhodanese-related sulfurtransferase
MESISSLNATTLKNWLEQGKPVTILDVRPLADRQEWAIPGSQHVDIFDKLKAGDKHALDAVSLPQNVPVVTVCAAGRMSLRAAGQLQAKGLEVYNLTGGINAFRPAASKKAFSIRKAAAFLFKRFFKR